MVAGPLKKKSRTTGVKKTRSGKSAAVVSGRSQCKKMEDFVGCI